MGTRPSARQPRRCQPLSLRPADQEIAALARQFDQQRLTGARAIIDALAQRARLRPDISRAAAADTMWLLMDPVVFRRRRQGATACPGGGDRRSRLMSLGERLQPASGHPPRDLVFTAALLLVTANECAASP